MDDEQKRDAWDIIEPAIELPSPVVRFHQVIENGEVADTLAVMANGQSISLNVLFGYGALNS